jgi:molybdenum cofactor guanylyltransferase
MPVSPQFSAVLLAAGHSTRMGRDKALLEVAGVSLWRRQRDVLAEAGASEIFLSARPEQAWASGATGFSSVLHDALTGCGPIVGVTAALERAAHPLVAVLAVDLPNVNADLFRMLLAQSSAKIGVVPRHNGRFEPLAAVYPREMMWLAWEALGREEYAMQQLVARGVQQELLRVHEVEDAATALFTNWNSEADRR